jgi:hypothetical protein
MKLCTKCKQLLSLDNFTKDKTKKDWYYSSCKSCNKKWISPWEKHLIKINDISKWFLTCTKCKQLLSLNNFRKDKSKRTWYYSCCNDCDRVSKWIKKRIPAKILKCSHCWIDFKPRVNQLTNKNNIFYCSRKCEMDVNLKNRTTLYNWYREYILQRDNYKCVISWISENLDIHHIKTRWSWWTNDYQNLIALSRKVHMSLAHWKEALKYKNIFLEYTSKFETPIFWNEIMIKSEWDDKRYNTFYKVKRKQFREKYIEDFKKEHDWLTPWQVQYRKLKKYKYTDR